MIVSRSLSFREVALPTKTANIFRNVIIKNDDFTRAEK